MGKGNCILKIVTTITAIVMLLAVSGCDNREKVVGHWQFSPEAQIVADSIADEVTSSLVIGGDGRVLLTTEISLTEPNSDSSNIYIDSVTVRAVASIEGRWSYVLHKNDEIDIEYDYSTFGVSIDPEDISYSPAAINRRVSMIYDIMKAATIEEYRHKLSPGLESHFDEFSRMEKISVSNGVMQCRSSRNTYTMTAL